MFTTKQSQFITMVESKYGPGATVTRKQLKTVAAENSVSNPTWLFSNEAMKVGRGLFKMPTIDDEKQPDLSPNLSAQVVQMRQPKLIDDSDVSIPEVYKDYVPFGFFKDMRNIVKSKMFYPVFVTGLSGNGKTLMVEQVCAELKRECIRVNISVETDETDLIGGPTLVNGNVVYRDGPVITAMKRGAILLIDEVDRGSNKLMCLQAILEGKPYFNKKSGEVVHPAEGFNVIATANTKGRGSDEGKYLSQILDDAFLERFPITVEQEYPDNKVEKKILEAHLTEVEFIDSLVKWAEVIRKTFDEGGVDELISTRRLVHIAQAYNIFKDKKKAIELCVSRFDEDTKVSFLDLFSKIENPDLMEQVETPVSEEPTEEIPF
jgi:MoxR-like ATPase